MLQVSAAPAVESKSSRVGRAQTSVQGQHLGIGAPIFNMPARNPWLTDSVYPTPTSGRGDSVASGWGFVLI